jgi:predicted transcriptional regulator
MAVSLSNREADIMAVLWELGPSTVTEVRARLSDDLAYTTVLTILRNLEAKGYATHSADGRAHRFAAAVRQSTARKSALRHLTGKLFKGSADLLLTHLVSDHKLTEDQVRRIRKILEENSK